MGVSGTLKALPSCQREVLKEWYDIKEYYYLPSVYGKSRREKFGCKVTKDAEHHKAIAEAVQLVAARRTPVMVYFDTIKALNNFFTSEEFASLRSRTSTLCETNDDHELKKRINFATRSGQITLLTKTFGRGIDFVVVEN